MGSSNSGAEDSDDGIHWLFPPETLELRRRKWFAGCRHRMHALGPFCTFAPKMGVEKETSVAEYLCPKSQEGKKPVQNYSLDELREMKELTETIKQNLAAIETSGWTLSELDDMRNEAAAVVTHLSFIDESEWELDSLQDLRKEA